MPSTANGMPYAAPKRPISPGHSRPISNDSTVPETAPTAKSTAATLDQRLARSRASASSRRSARQLATIVMNVNATPNGTRMMWKPRVNAICSRAGSSWGGSPAAPASAATRLAVIQPSFPPGRDAYAPGSADRVRSGCGRARRPAP